MRVFFILMVFMVALPVFGEKPKEWTGKYKDGKVITESDLKKILEDHGKWLEALKEFQELKNLSDRDFFTPKSRNLGLYRKLKEWMRAEGKRGEYLNLDYLNLQKTNLKGANFEKAKLSFPNFQEADLKGANFRKAKLSFPNFEKAKLHGANFEKAYLHGANFEKAYLHGVSFQEANLDSANFEGVDLRGINFEKADLYQVNLQRTDLRGTDLRGLRLDGVDLSEALLNKVIIELDSEKMPKMKSFLTAIGIHSIDYRGEIYPLIKIRNFLRSSNATKQEKEFTYLIHLNRVKRETGIIVRAIYYILIDLTCMWGLKPLQPLFIMFFLVILFSFFYTWILFKKNKEDGIWRIWNEDRVRKDLGKKEPELIQLEGTTAFLQGLYFSLLSAFHIGWHDFNIGGWVARLQFQEYTFRATGYVRFISGIQSIISIYLLILSLLSFTGKPLELIY